MESSDWIGQVLAGGSGGIIGAGLFGFFAQSWIKNKLAKNLESAKSEISFHAASRLKLHDKEYEVFPEIWAWLSDAKASLAAAIIQVRESEDFNSMSDEDFKKWLESTDFTKYEKDEMIDSHDRMSCFDRILDRRSLRRARESFREFQAYLQKTRIFLSPEIKEKFDEMIKGPFVGALFMKGMEVKLRGQAGYGDLRTARDIFKKDVEPLMEELEKIVQEKLFPEREATQQWNFPKVIKKRIRKLFPAREATKQ